MSTALADTSLAVAVDIGGTFTDIALYDAKSGQIWRAKTPSVPADPSQAFLAGVRLALEDAGRAAADARPRAARHDRRHQHDPGGQGRAHRPGDHQGFPPCAGDRPPGHPAPRQLSRLGEAAAPRAGLARVRGRASASAPAARSSRRWTKRACRPRPRPAARQKVEAVAVCLLHSFANPAHERRVAELLRAALPGIAVTASSDVLPVVREYERSLATVLNALVMPGVATYVSRLEDRLAEEKVEAPLLLHAVERRRRGRRHHPPRAGADGAVGSGRGRGRRARRGRRLRHQGHHHRRYRRHQRRHLPDQERHDRAHPARPCRRMAPAAAHGRHGDHRRGRRLDRPGRRRHADRGPAERRRRSGPGRLRPRRHRSDGDRRPCRARPSAGAAAGRAHGARCRGRGARRRQPRGAAARPRPRGSGARHAGHPRQQHDGRAAHRLGRARPRSARLHAGAVRRRRSPAWLRAGRAFGHPPRAGAAGARRALRRRPSGRRPQGRFQPHPAAGPARSTSRRRARSTPSCRSRPTTGSPRRRWRRPTASRPASP